MIPVMAVARMVAIIAVGIAVGYWMPLSSDYHNALISLGKRFPIIQTVGEYFHDVSHQKDTPQLVSPTRVVKTNLHPKEGTNKHDWMTGPRVGPDIKILTDEDIKYVEGEKLYLVMLGHVFDVTEGSNYYKPGSGYFGFIGQDASRAFVSGQFDKEGLVSDVTGMSNADYRGLAEWLKFYMEHEQYTHVGYHIGRFFDHEGQETDYMKKFKSWVAGMLKEEDRENDVKKLFPPCNVEWTAKTGTLFSCTKMSGGIDRDWVGVPRQFFQEPGANARCACVHPNYLADPRVKLYEKCDPKSVQCKQP